MALPVGGRDLSPRPTGARQSARRAGEAISGAGRPGPRQGVQGQAETGSPVTTPWFTLLLRACTSYNGNLDWGGSSIGRASRSQCEGWEFDPPPLHLTEFFPCTRIAGAPNDRVCFERRARCDTGVGLLPAPGPRYAQA